jgi:ribonuclease HI
MTAHRAAKISKRVAETIQRKKPMINGIRRGTMSKAQKRDELRRILITTLNEVATDVLKTTHSRTVEHAIPPVDLSPQWNELTRLVHLSLGLTLDTYLHAPVSLTGPEIERLRTAFDKHDISLPTDRPAWLKWWSNVDTHRIAALGRQEDLNLSDNLARTNPKRFYSQATRPLSSSKIPALRTTKGIVVSDAGIERTLTAYLQGVGAQPEAPAARDEEECISPSDPKLLSIMAAIDEDTLLHMVGTLDSTSAPGYDGVSPALIKTVLLTPWNTRQPKNASDLHQDALNLKFHTENWGNRHDLGHRQGYHMPVAPPPSRDPCKNVLVDPTATRNLFLEVLNLCLETRDIPRAEKHGITTGLPKTEGLVTSTDDLRPISVGPAFGRLLNKIMADRLSTLLVRHQILDPAQFAFLPGGDVHEPINSTLACYRDSKRFKKSCYAVFYDISKAYDTVRWSSIRQAMQRIGLGPDFISFVMNSLQGTTLAMRTNIPGRVTPTVEMHRAIKQGCPLAPLLFIIVMDELHTALSKHQGYGLGPPGKGKTEGRVKSRGYCDDTCIMSNTLADLSAMNDTVREFFAKHGLQLNQIKTTVTGRHADGSDYTKMSPGPHLPGSLESFTTVPPTAPVKYLGAHITLSLDWKPQIHKMNTGILLMVRNLDSKRFTTLQATCLTKYVTGPRLEIGLRHADVSPKQLAKWDTWIAAALARSANLGTAQLHSSGINQVCKLTPLADQYDLIKLTYALELVTRKSSLRKHYRSTLDPLFKEIENHTSHWPTRDASGINPKHTTHPPFAASLCRLAAKGLRIRPNKGKHGSKIEGKQAISKTAPPKAGRSGAHPNPEEDDKATAHDDVPLMVTFKGIPIPTWKTHNLWGSSFDKRATLAAAIDAGTAPPRLAKWASLHCAATTTTYHHPDCHMVHGRELTTQKTLAECMRTKKPHAKCAGCRPLWPKDNAFVNSLFKAIICTDGSTYANKRSASAFAFCEDGIRHKELWQEKGFYWTITVTDNYVAELAAIHAALRSIPVNVNLVIHTDSLSAVQSIRSTLRAPEHTNYLRKAGRPYIRAICHTIAARQAHGATTRILHVRAHTGGRDTPSIGNSAADRMAKWQAWEDEEPDSAMNLMHNENAYVLHTCAWTPPDERNVATETRTPVHGDIRAHIKKHLAALRLLDWGSILRPKRGALARSHPVQTCKAIDNLWSWGPSSSAISMMMTCLHQVTPKEINPDGSYTHEQCLRCGTKAPRTPLHRTRGCPQNGPDNRRLERALDRLTGFPLDQGVLQTEGPVPNEMGPLPSVIPSLVEANRRSLIEAIKAAGVATVTGRTIRYPAPPGDRNRHMIDAFVEVGQISYLYTTSLAPTAPPLAALPSAHVPPPAPAPAPRIRARPRRRWDPHYCYTCGGLGVLLNSCPIHRMCFLHPPPSDTGPPCSHCDSEQLTQPANTTTQLAQTIERLILNTTHREPHTLTPALRQICRQVLRTYSDLHLNPLTARHPWDTAWYTNDKGCQALGGTYHPNPEAFLTNRYTWVGLSHPTQQTIDLHCAAAAIQSSSLPTRTVHLMTDTVMNRSAIQRTGHDIRAHILARLPPVTVPTQSSSTTLGEPDTIQPKHPTALILVLLENKQAPGFPPDHLAPLLKSIGATEIHSQPPWKYPTLPPDCITPGPRPEPAPSHPLLRPSLLFCRGDRPYSTLICKHLTPPDTPARTKAADSVHSILGVLGITPPGFEKVISKATEHSHIDHTGSGLRVAKLILNTSLNLFLRDEAYHKWKRKT